MKSLNQIIDDMSRIGEPVIRLPRGKFVVEQTVVASGPFAIIGSGEWFTEILPASGVTCFNLSAHNGSSRKFSSTSPNDDHKLGILLSGFHIRGTQGHGQRGIVFTGACDEVRCDNLRFENLDQAIVAGVLDKRGVGCIRESRFAAIVVQNCGTKSLAAVDFTQRNSPARQDGINHLELRDWRIIYSPGTGLLIADHSNSEIVRHIQMIGFMAHGGPNAANQSGPVIHIEGGVYGVQLIGLRGSAISDCVVRVSAVGNARPRSVYIQGQVTGQSLGVDLQAVDDCIVNVQSFRGHVLYEMSREHCTGVFVNGAKV